MHAKAMHTCIQLPHRLFMQLLYKYMMVLTVPLHKTLSDMSATVNLDILQSCIDTFGGGPDLSTLTCIYLEAYLLNRRSGSQTVNTLFHSPVYSLEISRTMGRVCRAYSQSSFAKWNWCTMLIPNLAVLLIHPGLLLSSEGLQSCTLE